VGFNNFESGISYLPNRHLVQTSFLPSFLPSEIVTMTSPGVT